MDVRDGHVGVDGDVKGGRDVVEVPVVGPRFVFGITAERERVEVGGDATRAAPAVEDEARADRGKVVERREDHRDAARQSGHARHDEPWGRNRERAASRPAELGGVGGAGDVHVRAVSAVPEDRSELRLVASGARPCAEEAAERDDDGAKRSRHRARPPRGAPATGYTYSPTP